ncbi:MAG: hypothetical protein MJE66_16795 [Proteobacteria bacterium]|nr:hypothetical protein [Pseudomonadota bacterium]
MTMDAEHTPWKANGNGAELGSEFERFLRYASAAEQNGRGRLNLRSWMDLAETWRITQALRDCGGNRSAAARALGIGRRTLYAKMEKLSISPIWSVPDSPTGKSTSVD